MIECKLFLAMYGMTIYQAFPMCEEYYSNNWMQLLAYSENNINRTQSWVYTSERTLPSF